MTLKKKVLTGTKWVAFANIFRQVLQLISLVMFTRILTPDDFGIFSILMIFVGFMQMFTDMGTGAAIVHIKNPSDKLLSSIFFFNLFIGLLLSLILILISNPIAYFFETPQIKVLLEIISISFIIESFGVIQRALYQKHLNFKRLTIIEFFSAFVSLAIGIGAALYGMGVVSLILQSLSASILMVVLLWIYSDWRPMLYFALDDIKHIWEFTKNISIFSVVNYFSRKGDNFLIGKFLGSSALGVYSIAYKIMLYPLNNISRTLLKILFPAFSQIQDDNQKFRKAYLRTIFFIALVSFPIMAGLMATADILVPILFGEKWKNLAILLIILAPVGMIESITTTTGSIYMAKGETRTLMRIGIVTSIVTVAFFAFGLPFGVEGVAASYLLSNLILLYPVLKLAWAPIELSVKRGFSEMFPILIISTIMGISVVVFGKIFNSFYHNSHLQLAVMVLGGILVYYFLIRLKYGSIKVLLSELK